MEEMDTGSLGMLAVRRIHRNIIPRIQVAYAALPSLHRPLLLLWHPSRIDIRPFSREQHLRIHTG